MERTNRAHVFEADTVNMSILKLSYMWPNSNSKKQTAQVNMGKNVNRHFP